MDKIDNMIKLEIVNETEFEINQKELRNSFDLFAKTLKRRIREKLGKHCGLIDLILVYDKHIQEINKEYRKKDEATDVISFAYLEVTEFEGEETDVITGDIFISIDTAKKQAKMHKHSLKKELDVLFIHGLLHIFGFDHKNDEEENEMETWAKKVLKHIV